MKNSIKEAEKLGSLDYEQGIMRVPAHSNLLMEIIRNRKIGTTPKNEIPTTELMRAWIKGWDKAKEIKMKEKFGF